MVFDKIQDKLIEKGITIDPSTIKKRSGQGFMSEIYTAESNKGKLVIHLIKPVDEQKKQKVYEKVFYVSKILKNAGNIPNADVLAFGKLSEDDFFTVQRFIQKENLGERSIKGKEIINTYNLTNTEECLSELKRIIADIHQIPMKGYGFLTVKDGELRGEYDGWLTFLKKGVAEWLENTYKTSQDKNKKPYISEKEHMELKNKLASFFDKYQEHFTCKKGKLIHGDMINPGNVLVKDNKIVGIIDFEWAAAGDPAWEFAFTNEEPLDDYFEQLKENGIDVNKEQFKLKTKLYSVLWLLWGTNVHAKGEELKILLFDMFKKNLDKWV